MSEYIQFVAKEPEVKPASEEVVYDKFWMKNLRIMAPNPTQPIKVVATFVSARDIQIEHQGQTITIKELNPNGKEYRVVINNLFEKASQDADVAEVTNKLLTALLKLGIEQEVFAAPE